MSARRTAALVLVSGGATIAVASVASLLKTRDDKDRNDPELVHGKPVIAAGSDD